MSSCHQQHLKTLALSSHIRERELRFWDRTNHALKTCKVPKRCEWTKNHLEMDHICSIKLWGLIVSFLVSSIKNILSIQYIITLKSYLSVKYNLPTNQRNEWTNLYPRIQKIYSLKRHYQGSTLKSILISFYSTSAKSSMCSSDQERRW